jgi:hypothetical protein
MLNVQEKVVYKAFGLKITSDIPLPELIRLNERVDIVDLEIKLEDLSKRWSELSNIQNAPLINERFVMFQVPNIATFLIREGSKISVSPINELNEDVIRLFLLGSCMGVILMQRGVFPLHGSAMVINGKAYAIIGESGAGKSTLASAFLDKGYQLLTDDIIAVSLSKDNIPFITPSYPQQKLWEESINYFGMEKKHYRSIFGRETKYCIPVIGFSFDSYPLSGVFELVKNEKTGCKVTPINGLKGLHTLYKHTYRNYIITPLNLLESHFSFSAKVIDKIDLFRLERPLHHFSVHELTNIILNTIKGENFNVNTNTIG